MSVQQYGTQKFPHTESLENPTDRQRRRILRLLAAESQPVTARELAEKLVTIDEANAVDDVPAETIEGVQVRLRHDHLPTLAASGLVDWDADGGSVEATDHPVYDDVDAQPPIEIDDDRRGAACVGVPDGRIRDIIAVLQSDGERVSRNVLAHRVAAIEATGDSPASDVDSVRNSLHHVHLPRLADAGVLDYDAEDGTVTYRGTTSGDESQR